jgi:hypothetical protein
MGNVGDEFDRLFRGKLHDRPGFNPLGKLIDDN